MFDRRGFLGVAGSTALLPKMAIAQTSQAFVSSDFGLLRRVLVSEPVAEDFGPSLTDRGLFSLPEGRPEDMIAQHRAMQQHLRAAGAEVLSLQNVLQSAIETARSRGQWRTWLRAVYPRLAGAPDSVSALTLLGRDPAARFEADGNGEYRHFADASIGKMFTRDQGVMTPRGFILSNLHPPHRRPESQVMRFALDFTPQLARYPVVFDAAVEGLYAEGGDFQVVDQETIFIGVGNRTDPRVGPLLAKRLGMDVVTVQTRKVETLKWGKSNEMRSRLLHLDTYFTHVGPKQALTLPWLLEQEHAGKDVLTRYLTGLLRYEASVEDSDVEGALAFLKDFGRIRRFRAGTGEEDKSIGEMKLVDYVRSLGYRIHYVGGEPPAKPDFDYLFEVVLAEHAFQAANVVAIAPNSVVAYDGARRTIASLRQGGVKVATFPGRELWIGNGGPHCLTLPLERA